jgi:hypothetical protein
MKFLDARLVGGDRCALHTDAEFSYGVRGIQGNLVAGRIAVFDAEVVVAQIDGKVRQDELLPDRLPDHPGHLVAVELDDRIANAYLLHDPSLSRTPARFLARTALVRRAGPWTSQRGPSRP